MPKFIHRAFIFCIASFLQCLAAKPIETDICVYGGNASGAAAAVQAARMGKSVVLLEFGNHIGGLTSGGLGATDIGNKEAIGGISREFYRRLGKYYGTNEMWTFEPSVAERTLREMLKEANVPIHFQQRLASVKKKNARITEIKMEDGSVYRAKVFIDATYEGDLMAKAKVSYTVGREANSKYNETLNGIRGHTPQHQFNVFVDPYVKPGDPKSGLLPFIQSEPLGDPGTGDHRVQAYNFRLTLTQNETNRLPIAPPKNYDAKKYELLARDIEARVAAGEKLTLDKFWGRKMMPNGKTDANNSGAFSTDAIGMNWDYPEANYKRRAQIWKEHEDYTRGFLHFLATSERVPKNLRDEMNSWGLCKDEFQDNGGWMHQLYVREARRMISDYVMTEYNCRGIERAEDSIGLAAYTMDSHNCQRIARDGAAENEGDVQVRGFSPYPISYRSLIPKQSECENLVVPVCLAATHIAYGSIRMEPVFMILGQSAATAAALAITDNCALQKIKYEQLRQRLVADKQILQWTGPVRVLQMEPHPQVKVVSDGESKTSPDACRGTVVGPGINQPDPFPGYHGFVGWDTPIRLKNGTWLVGFNAGYWHASPPTPLHYSQKTIEEYRRMGMPDVEAPTGGRAMIVRSTDEGKTWSKPETLMDTPLDDRHPAFVELNDGTVLCSFFTYNGEPKDGDLAKDPAAAARVWFIRSFDGGKTWEKKPRMIETPFLYDETDGPLKKIKDGSVLVAINGRDKSGPPDVAGIFRSTDKGESWKLLSTLKADHDLVEVTVAELHDGRFVFMARPEGDIAWSRDKGHTWTKPVTFGFRMFAPSLTVLRDGTLVCLHGSYAPGNPGLRVIFSTDGGETWVAPAKDHGFLVDNVYGYGKATELPDGSLFVTYLATGGHRTEDAKGNAIHCIRLRVRPDHSGIDLLPAPNR